jgi:hypothetical protein
MYIENLDYGLLRYETGGRRRVRLRDVWILVIKSFMLWKKRECERERHVGCQHHSLVPSSGPCWRAWLRPDVEIVSSVSICEFLF